MRIAVVGAGGVGGYFGGRLAQAGVDTTFIVRGPTLKALRETGLQVESVTGDFHLKRVDATDDPSSVGAVDAVLMAVKAWQLPEAAANIIPLIGEETMVVPLENGVEAPEVLAPILGREHVLGGLCAIVSYIVSPGHIRHPAFDPFMMFGELDNRRTLRVERLLETFTSAGIKAEIPLDIHRSMWSKFLFIAPMSGVGAITRVPIGVWRSQPEVHSVADHLLKEIAAVATARGHDLGEDAVHRTWERYDAMTPESTASLQRDVMAGKPSELEAQLGAAVRIGREAGVATPVTELLYHCLLPQERLARETAGTR
jgi:2-dehydropantoate 2-reductase